MTIVDVPASMDGLLRGLIRDGYPVTKGFKIADIDPRAEEYDNCFTISDKARCIAGGVLEALLYLKNNLSDQQEEPNVPICTHEKQKVKQSMQIMQQRISRNQSVSRMQL